MIYREMKDVTYRAYDNTKDEYGQLKQNFTDSTIKMMIKIRSQVNVEDPRFIDCDCIGITDKVLKPGNKIIDDTQVYLIQYAIPSSRRQQVFLKCEK